MVNLQSSEANIGTLAQSHPPEQTMSTLVVKVGGGVLRDSESYNCVADCLSDLYRTLHLDRLLVVVSGKYGATNNAITNICSNPSDEEKLRKALKGQGIFGAYENVHTTGYLLQPEIDSAQKLGAEIQNKGIDALVLDQNHVDWPIIANSSYLSAIIDHEESDKREDVLRRTGMTVVSGYGARNLLGEKVLLGRNATDLVAAKIAIQARADMLLYFKDKNGIYADDTCKGEPFCEIIASKTDMGQYSQVLYDKASQLLMNTGIDVRLGMMSDALGIIQGSTGTSIKFSKEQ